MDDSDELVTRRQRREPRDRTSFFFKLMLAYLNFQKDIAAYDYPIGAEKLVVTKGPGAIGARVGGGVGVRLIAASVVLSQVAEVAGAVLTPFGTTAMAIARDACTCKQK
jgi:hypothetical protein